MKVKSYVDLIVWEESMDLVGEIYTLTKLFPKEEMYGLTSQMRRAAVSIPSNVAEGSRRSTRKDFRYFVINAYSSGVELETQIEISKRLLLAPFDFFEVVTDKLIEVMKMLNSLSNKLK